MNALNLLNNKPRKILVYQMLFEVNLELDILYVKLESTYFLKHLTLFLLLLTYPKEYNYELEDFITNNLKY